MVKEKRENGKGRKGVRGGEKEGIKTKEERVKENEKGRRWLTEKSREAERKRR